MGHKSPSHNTASWNVFQGKISAFFCNHVAWIQGLWRESAHGDICVWELQAGEFGEVPFHSCKTSVPCQETAANAV